MHYLRRMPYPYAPSAPGRSFHLLKLRNLTRTAGAALTAVMLVACTPGTAAPSGDGRTVSTTAGLLAAVAKAKPGDSIALAPGNYSGVLLRNISFADKPVVLKSVDPSRPAILKDLALINVSGLTLSGLELYAGPSSGMFGFKVQQSRRITLDRLVVHADRSVDGKGISPLMIRLSENVTVQDSEFHHVWHGVTMLDCRAVEIRGNRFHDLRTDAIRGGGVSDLLVEDNVMTDFFPEEKDHPDAIQLWSTNQTAAARNIVIRGNQVIRGKGKPAQGVFIRDTFDKLPFENVEISNNIIVGGLFNGIAIRGVKGAVIRGNQVIGFPDQKSWIRVDNGTQVFMQENSAQQYVLQNSSVRQKDNRTSAPARDGGLQAVNLWRGKATQLRP